MKIYIVNGAPGAGKTTFEECIKLLIGSDRCNILSTIEFVKYIATQCGWDGSKSNKNRKFLSDLKDILTEWNDVPYKRIEENLKSIREKDEFKEQIVFIDCREPEEIKKLCKKLNAKSVCIRNEKAEKTETSNHADQDVLNYNYSCYLENNGTKYDLLKTVIGFLNNEEIEII